MMPTIEQIAALQQKVEAISRLHGFFSYPVRTILPCAVADQLQEKHLAQGYQVRRIGRSGKHSMVSDPRLTYPHQFALHAHTKLPLRVMHNFYTTKGTPRTLIDILGGKAIEAEIELLGMLIKILPGCTVHINHAGLVRSVLQKIDVPEHTILRILRKQRKSTPEQIQNALKTIDVTEDKIKAVQKWCSSDITINELFTYTRDQEACDEINNLLDQCKERNIEAKFDATVLPQHNYFDGILFRIHYKESIIASGGRFNKLCSALDETAATIPSVGITLHLRKLFAALETETQFIPAKILLTPLATTTYTGKIATTLRDAGISVATDVNKKSISRALQSAKRQNIPFVIIIGKQEIEKQAVQVKNMKEESQEEVPMAELVEYFSSKINK